MFPYIEQDTVQFIGYAGYRKWNCYVFYDCRNWKERRKFDKQVVQERVKKIIDDSKKKETNNDKAEDGKVVDRPSLPKGTKLITIPVVELEAMDENHEVSDKLMSFTLRPLVTATEDVYPDVA